MSLTIYIDASAKTWLLILTFLLPCPKIIHLYYEPALDTGNYEIRDFTSTTPSQIVWSLDFQPVHPTSREPRVNLSLEKDLSLERQLSKAVPLVLLGFHCSIKTWLNNRKILLLLEFKTLKLFQIKDTSLRTCKQKMSPFFQGLRYFLAWGVWVDRIGKCCF